MKRTTRRTIVTTLLVLLAATPALAQDSVTRRIEVGEAGELRLVNVAGDITITGAAATQSSSWRPSGAAVRRRATR